MNKLISLFIFLLTCWSFDVWSQDDIEVISIENPAVAAYMKDYTYFSLPDTSTLSTIVPDYYDKEKYGDRLDWPGGKSLKWKRTVSSKDISEIRITVSEKKNLRDSLTFYTSKTTDTTYVIRNLFPNRTYYYKAEEYHKDGSMSKLASGCFQTVGKLRMVHVAGASNVRDMGGWPSILGGKIRYGRLYRSANLDRITWVGLHDFVDNLNVRAELDLRGESKLKDSALGTDCDFIKIVSGSYDSSLKKNGQLFARDLEWIVDRLREGKSVDWHCAIGCDRCGTLSFVVGGILGMNEIDLGRDYELSYFAGHKRTCSSAVFQGMLRFIKRQKINPDDNLTKCFYNYLVSNGMPEDYIKYLRDTMIEKYHMEE